MNEQEIAVSKSHPLTNSRYIVTNPKICHGKPTFRGTRILVSDVLEQVSNGMAWETIIDEWNGSITRNAISEAIMLCNQARSYSLTVPSVSTLKAIRSDLSTRLEPHQLDLVRSLIEAEVLQNASIKRILRTKVNETLRSFGIDDAAMKNSK